MKFDLRFSFLRLHHFRILPEPVEWRHLLSITKSLETTDDGLGGGEINKMASMEIIHLGRYHDIGIGKEIKLLYVHNYKSRNEMVLHVSL